MAKKKRRSVQPKPVEAVASVQVAEHSPSWESQMIGNLFRTPFGTIAVLIGVPLLVRLLHFLFMLPSPLFRTVVMMDATWYHQQAIAMTHGMFAPPEGFFRPPFYAFFLALVYLVFKPTVGILAVRLIQCVLGSVNCFLAFRLGERFFSRRVGWIGWLICSLYGPLFFFDNELLSPVWEVFFNLCLLLALSRAEGNTSKKWWALAGLCLGMSSITRANILPFLPVMIFWLVWRTRRWWAFDEWTRPALLAVVLALAPGLLVGVRNKIGYGEFIFIAHQGGLTFYVSNNPEADGLCPVLPGKPDFTQSDAARMVADETNNPDPSPGQVADYFSRKARTYIKENPGRFLLITLKRCYHFLFSSFEAANNVEFDFYGRESVPKMLLFWRLGRFYFPSGLVLPLMWCGIILSLTRWRRLSILYLYLLVQFASFALFFVVARFRLPSVPIWALFAGQALTAQIGNRNMTRKQFARVGIVFLILLVLVNADPWGASARIGSVRELSEAMQLIMEENFDDARVILERYLQAQPASAIGHVYLSSLFTRQGMQKLAEGDTNTAADHVDSSIRHALRAVELSPDRKEMYQQLAEAYRAQGHFTSTFIDDDEVRQRLIADEPPPPIIELTLEHYHNAEQACEKAIEMAQPYEFNVLLANILYRRAGVIEYLARTAKEVRSDDTWRTFCAEAKRMCEKILLVERNADHYYLYGSLFLMEGDVESARVQFKTALELDIFHPASTQALKELGG